MSITICIKDDVEGISVNFSNSNAVNLLTMTGIVSFKDSHDLVGEIQHKDLKKAVENLYVFYKEANKTLDFYYNENKGLFPRLTLEQAEYRESAISRLIGVLSAAYLQNSNIVFA